MKPIDELIPESVDLISELGKSAPICSRQAIVNLIQKEREEAEKDNTRAVLQMVNKVLKEDGIKNNEGEEISFLYWQDKEVEL